MSSEQKNLAIATLGVEDLEEWLRWRREVIQTVFGSQEAAFLDELMEANRRYYQTRIAQGDAMAILAWLDGKAVGSGFLCFHDELPSPDNPSGRCAYLMNIYVKPEARRNGVGGKIIRWLVREARNRAITKIYLESTIEAKPLYGSQGFIPMEDMLIYDTETFG